MKTDRELLELAAKAAGYRVAAWKENDTALVKHPSAPESCMVFPWAPLKDDGDALRLADKLGLIVDAWNERAMQAIRHGLGHRDWVYASEDQILTGLEATRRAIVRAAAAIGEAMP